MSEILFLVVENYIKVGEPVGSRKICECMHNPPSAATVRNEMASLSALGLLEQTHISSGRIPTLDGYRFYINYLITKKKLSNYEKSYIYGMFDDISYDPEGIIKKSCEVLSKITDCTVISATPPIGDAFVRDIKFVKVGLRTVVLILITSSGMVQNQIFNCDFEINDRILDMFRIAVNSEFEGRKIKLLADEAHRIVSSNENKDMLIIPAFEAAFKAIKKACQIQLVVKGERFLFDFLTPNDSFSILDFIYEKKFSDFLFSSSNDIKIYIGSDCGIDKFSNCSIVIKKYNVGIYQGVISSIGPTNMNYSDVIAKVSCISGIVQELFAKIISY